MDGLWYVYLLRCADGTLYTGVTTDIERRVLEHNSQTVGAKYTRARRPVQLVYVETWKSRSEAQKREAEIKHMSRQEKQRLVQG